MRNIACITVLLLTGLLSGCTHSVFIPVSSPNPWADDYSSLSSMEITNHGEPTMYTIRRAAR